VRPNELEKPHRPQAFVGVAEEAIGICQSTGVAPQLLQPLDPSSPSTTRVAEGRRSWIQPTAIRHPYSMLRTLAEEKGQHQHHLTEMIKHRPRTPVHSSTTPPLAPEWNATRARKRPGDVIPLRRRRHRLADAGRKSPSRREHGPRRRGRRCLQRHTNRSSRTSPPANRRPRHNPRPIYTSARRFPGRPPSPTPDWPPERKRAGEIAAGRRNCAAVAFFASSQL